ncbi:Gfo/Idh/MocA family protein [Tamlana crocina]|uniref:Gfo/Idh/MocA family oxidoreductase n=1 Tax=Tamlana crocina TaxID=393006 RepID=A0ABX1DG72_9FLAO|nr:Gfo/Idh/MocA family oxidoreductase [Tamlana crocina]NJX16266.1 Gfo/Idh/MocA family oxidoreductase [Tamlana crocina]
MTKTIKFVIVGSGNIASTYLSAVNNISKAEVVGVVSRKSEKPKALNHLPFFKSISEVTIDFNAVIICTPNGLHHISAVEAANKGKHVLCEKPIDITLEAIDKMIEASKKNDVKLGVAYQRRYSSDNPIVKKMIDSGELGRVFSVDLSVKNYRDDAYYDSAPYRGTYKIDGGGPFIQQACHYIDLYYWFFGKPKKLVSQLGTFVHDIEVEDHGAAICLHDSGMIGTITASTATKPGFPAKMEIYTSKGYLILDNDVITHWDIEGVENPTAQTPNENTHTGAATAAVADTTNHEMILNDFIAAIQTGGDCLISGESARNATEMILEIYNSQF